MSSLTNGIKKLFSARWENARCAHATLLELHGRPIRNPRFLGMSKPGRLSWFAYWDEQPAKIYECHNESQAVFIETLSKDPLLGVHFPTCLLRDGVYLVVEWVVGKQMTWQEIRRDRNLLQQVVRLQSLIHSKTLRLTTGSAPLSYIDYLRERFLRYKGIFPFDEAISGIFSVLEDNRFVAEERISHPDLTADNLVLDDSTMALKVIDNELVTQSHYYLIDLFNTHKSFGRKFEGDLLERYLDNYVENGCDLSLLVKHKSFFATLWYLRLIGSALQAGAIRKALLLAQQYTEGRTEEHPLFQLVKRRFL